MGDLHGEKVLSRPDSWFALVMIVVLCLLTGCTRGESRLPEARKMGVGTDSGPIASGSVKGDAWEAYSFADEEFICFVVTYRARDLAQDCAGREQLADSGAHRTKTVFIDTVPIAFTLTSEDVVGLTLITMLTSNDRPIRSHVTTRSVLIDGQDARLHMAELAKGARVVDVVVDETAEPGR